MFFKKAKFINTRFYKRWQMGSCATNQGGGPASRLRQDQHTRPHRAFHSYPAAFHLYFFNHLFGNSIISSGCRCLTNAVVGLIDQQPMCMT